MKYVVIILAILAGNFVKAQPSVDIIDYINTYKQLAIEEMQRTGVPASIKLAQGIHETFAGKSVLVLKSNNHFGIKCKIGWTGKKVYHDDDARGECFRSYGSSTDSYMDHSNFLKNGARYAFLFSLNPEDYQGWAYGLKKAGYATNIRYSNILIKIIESYNLQQYSLIAMGKLSASDENLVQNPTNAATNSIPSNTEDIIQIENAIPEAVEAPAVIYPSGQFTINNTKVIFARAGSSLLSIAEKHEIAYNRLLEFNDMKDIDVLVKDQLLFLQRKRKQGSNEYHIVQKGESLFDISQVEGIRLESLTEYNNLNAWMQPAIGEKLYLQTRASLRPVLASETFSAIPSVSSNNNNQDKSTHIVQSKETLYSISKKYGVGINKIMEWNQMEGFELRIGQELVINKN